MDCVTVFTWFKRSIKILALESIVLFFFYFFFFFESFKSCLPCHAKIGKNSWCGVTPSGTEGKQRSMTMQRRHKPLLQHQPRICERNNSNGFNSLLKFSRLKTKRLNFFQRVILVLVHTLRQMSRNSWL